MNNTEGMTVQELIDVLSQYDPNVKVHFVYQSGDYWRTVIATPITSFDIGNVEYNERCEDFTLKADEEYPDKIDSDYVVILS